MRLEWKYTLLINVFILITMSAFFVIDDRVLKNEIIWSAIREKASGATMRDIASDIQRRIAGENDAGELTKIIRSINLQKSGSEIVDINVTDANGVVIASLTGSAIFDQLDEDALKRVWQGQMRVRYPPRGYYGHWVIEYTLPYVISNKPEGNVELGALQVMFSAQEIAKYSQRFRIKRLFYIAGVTALLTIFINPLTSYLIVRRLERLMETTASALAGNLSARAIDSSRDEIGRLSSSFNKMIDQIAEEHARRLTALGTLAAGVAHEVRNPLNSIAITIQYLKDIIKEGQDPQNKDSYPLGGQPTCLSEAQECLDVISKQVKELNRILEEFLQLTRQTEMNWEVVDLNAFISDVLLNFVALMETENIRLICNYSKAPLFVKIDKDKLRRAISNIVLNGIQAMPDGGELSLTTKSPRESGDGLQKSVIIEIKDTGVGIPQENIDRLFEPYFTTKPDGTGLGLAITYKIIEAHGGKITVESEEGQGATFIITLPQGTTPS